MSGFKIPARRWSISKTQGSRVHVPDHGHLPRFSIRHGGPTRRADQEPSFLITLTETTPWTKHFAQPFKFPLPHHFSPSPTHIRTETILETRLVSCRTLTRRTQQGYRHRVRSSTIPHQQTRTFTSITSAIAHHVCGTRSRITQAQGQPI